MARTSSRAATARRSRNNIGNGRSIYVEGAAARRLAEAPARDYAPAAAPARRRRQEPEKSARPVRPVSVAAQKNRDKATSMSGGFVVFLAVVSAAILFCCIHYIQLKSQITASMKNVASLESELSELKEDNDAYYSEVVSNVDLTRIKKIAITRLEMKYPSDDQIMTYTTAPSSYVRQYQDVPDAK